MSKQADVIIVGGGVIGSSIAYNLLNDGFDGDIVLLEKDKTYEYASTPRSAGGIRQLFTTGINVEMGKYAVEKYSTFKEDMATDDELAEIDFKQNGYFFLGNNVDNINQIAVKAALQRQL